MRAFSRTPMLFGARNTVSDGERYEEFDVGSLTSKVLKSEKTWNTHDSRHENRWEHVANPPQFRENPHGRKNVCLLLCFETFFCPLFLSFEQVKDDIVPVMRLVENRGAEPGPRGAEWRFISGATDPGSKRWTVRTPFFCGRATPQIPHPSNSGTSMAPHPRCPARTAAVPPWEHPLQLRRQPTPVVPPGQTVDHINMIEQKVPTIVSHWCKECRMNSVHNTR